MWDRVHSCFVCSLFLMLLRSVSGWSRCGSTACRAGSSAQICPRGPETAESLSGWEVSVLSASVPSVASLPRPPLPAPAEPPPLALCVWTLLPVDSPLSGLSHATVSNHPAHPPLNPEPRPSSPTSSWPWEREIVMNESEILIYLHLEVGCTV